MLVVIYSVLSTALFGSGALICRGLQPRGERRAFTSLAAGLSCLHALTLLGLPLVLVLAAVFAMAGVEGFLRHRETRTWTIAASDARWVVAIFASALPLWAFTMCRPLWAFDARNVWFFSGRIIFTEGHFPIEVFHRLMCHWGPDYRLNTNADYPKLIGSLAASVATMAGYWNEYLPKIGILVLHTLSLFGLIELGWRARAILLNLIVTGVSMYRYYFDSASLDIHVALLTLVGLLCLVRAAEDPADDTAEARPATLGMAVAAIAVGSQLKYEGRALAAIIGVVALASGVVSLRALRRAAPLFLLFVPTALWLVEVRVFRVPSYLQYSGGMPVALSRLRTDFFNHIVPGIAGETRTIVGLGSLALGLAAAKFITPALSFATLARAPGVRLGVLTAFGYAVALAGVYLVTPYARVLDQMSSSIERATLPIEGALLAAAIAVVERAWRAHASTPAAALPSSSANDIS